MTALVAVLALALAAETAPAAGSLAPAAIPAPAAPTAPAEGAGPVRVERRLLEKSGHFFATGGPGWLARGDWYANPSLSLSVTRYLGERSGPDLRASIFFSRLTSAGREVEEATGLVPDAQQPRALVTLGWRWSVGYGKTLVTPSSGVLHFDLQLAAGGGVLVTDRSVAPALLAGPAVLARLGSRLVAQLDVALDVSFEDRAHASFTPGVLATIGLGGWL